MYRDVNIDVETSGRGATGPKGDKGETGNTGPVSTTPGPVGPQGPKGDKGDPGTNGATGPQGAQGPIGPQGADGAPGAKGDKGDTGAQGPQGAQGQTGGAGPKGDKGDKGDPTPADDTPYGPSWNADTTNAPSKNAAFDVLENRLLTTPYPGFANWRYIPLDGIALSVTGDDTAELGIVSPNAPASAGGIYGYSSDGLNGWGLGGQNGYAYLTNDNPGGQLRLSSPTVVQAPRSTDDATLIFQDQAGTLQGQLFWNHVTDQLHLQRFNAAGNVEGQLVIGYGEIISYGALITNQGNGTGYLYFANGGNCLYWDSTVFHFTDPLYIGGHQVLTSGDVGVANGVASLGADGKVPASQLPASSGGGGGGLTDGDMGDVKVSGGGTAMTVESAAGDFAVGGNMTLPVSKLITVGAVLYVPVSSYIGVRGASGVQLRVETDGISGLYNPQISLGAFANGQTGMITCDSDWGYMRVGTYSNHDLVLHRWGSALVYLKDTGLWFGGGSGAIGINGNQVLGPRQVKPASPTLADVIACLDAHGLWGPASEFAAIEDWMLPIPADKRPTPEQMLAKSGAKLAKTEPVKEPA